MVITARETKVKAGYKLTEVGMMPEEWEAKNIGDLITFSGGSQPPRSTFKFQKREGYIRLIQIRDYKTNEYETYIPEEFARKKCTDSDIMIGRYGPPIFQILRGIEGAYNVALLKAIPSPQVNKEYLYQFLQQKSLFRYIELLSQRSSGQTGVEIPALKNYPFPCPPLPEQHAIATALSDVDALITSLDQLIAKKRAIKQATMQQLLTGRIRLLGFSGELKPSNKQTEVGIIPEDWNVKKLKDLCISIVDGTHYTPKYAKDGIPFYSVENITANNFTNTKFISLKEHTGLIRRCKPEKGDILLTRIGSLGYTKLVNWDINASIYVSLALLKINNQQMLADYLYAYSKSDQFVKNVEMRSLMNATPIKINMDQIGNIPIACPPLPEQQAIAIVLTDMDTEIVAVERKREKTRALKQGMMQELLTGKIRLL